MSTDLDRRREARLAAVKANRQTQQFAERGAALTADRAAEAAAARADADLRNEAAWAYECVLVSSSTLDRHVRAFRATVDEASADAGVEPDQIAFEMLDSYLLGSVLTTGTRRSVAVALELLRCEFGYSVQAGLDHLRRIVR